MATIRDIAQKANVSSVTVSRVLNRDQTFSVSDETRKRVLAIANELNYKTPRERKRQNGAASMDDTRIGTVLFLTEQQEEGDSYFGSIRIGIEKECEASGMKTTKVLRFSQYNTTDVNIGDVDGAIVIGSSLDNYSIIVNQAAHVVFVDYSPDVEQVDSVVIDFERATKLALDHLIAAGHTEIGFMGGIKRYGKDERHHYYETIMKERGLFKPEHVYIGDWSTNEGYETMLKVIARGRVPSAFFCANDALAIGALRASHEAGIRVPQDVAFVGFDDFPISAYVNPPLTTVRIEAEWMGRMAVKLLLDQMNGRDVPVQVAVPARLVVRDSCGFQPPAR